MTVLPYPTSSATIPPRTNTGRSTLASARQDNGSNTASAT
eukprot:CAMPEP_0196820918 /NCGR_PEP_ID=MMETSP1362-20130617/77102_1 /TAXON_ID=163516 /ORGANISM="Leptocylindrus danicus, Strain CCMP1856" /LENGTH=39 /DNA_ID= /DNA_START= /DNA_END= /DNA_ORIENTATION=